MCYVFELQTLNGGPAYAITHAGTQDEALADIREQLEDGDDELIVLAVHTVH